VSICEEDDLADKRQEFELLWNWGKGEQIHCEIRSRTWSPSERKQASS